MTLVFISALNRSSPFLDELTFFSFFLSTYTRRFRLLLLDGRNRGFCSTVPNGEAVMILDIRSDERKTPAMVEGVTVGDPVRLTDPRKDGPFRNGATGRVVWVSCWGLYHVRMD